MNQDLKGLNGRRGKNWAIASLLIGGLSLASCGGGSAPEDAATAPAPETPSTAAETAPAATAESAPAPTAEAAPAPQAAPAAAPNTAPANPPAGASIFVSDNFTVTITGFGIDAGYKGCDTKGQCLEIPIASSYDHGTYTWENGGHLYMMQQVVGGDYRLEVRDPQGKVLVDERLNAVHNSQSQQSAPPPGANDTVEMVDVTLWNLTQGDRGCYVELADGSGNRFTELGTFETCAQTELISRLVRVTLQEQNVMAESCQGDPDCTATERVPVVIEMAAQAEGL